MCGINGIIAYRDAPPVENDELIKVRDAMTTRGPDSAGAWISPNGKVGFGHRRLSIIDLSTAANQPMHSADGHYTITFNGEIYNYQELRTLCIAEHQYSFRTHSDTEVLLALYAHYGTAMVHKLRGMYTFAIYDQRNDSVFMGRDPFGIKPLYYWDNGKTLRFASTVKALRQSAHFPTAASPAGQVGLLLWGSVPEPYTLYRGVYLLKAGETLTLSKGQVKQYVHSNFVEHIRNIDPPHDQSLTELIRETMRYHLVADVPVGLFLSAGLDSSVLLASAAERRNIHTFTLGFSEFRNTQHDEVPIAQAVARHYRCQWDAQHIDKEHFADSLEHFLTAMDQPSIDGANTYFVSQVCAAQRIKVCISGLGGDELFGGYPSFQRIPFINRTLSLRPIALVGKTLAALCRHFAPKYAGLFTYAGDMAQTYYILRGLYMPWELPDVLEPDIIAEGWETLQHFSHLTQRVNKIGTPWKKVMALEMSYYMRNQLLRDSDWAGMAHSVEIRVPFVDVFFLRQVLPLLHPLPQLEKRQIFRTLNLDLPATVHKRRKTGFNIPILQWASELGLCRADHKSWLHFLMTRSL